MSLIDCYEGFIFDLDGTVYLGEELLPGAVEVVEAIRRADRQIIYLTNKPLEPSAAYAAKLTRLGLPTPEGDVVSSLDSLVQYMIRMHPSAPTLCVSEPLVAETLEKSGFPVVSVDNPEEAAVVVVSFDRTFDYRKLHAAFRAVRAGAVIVATNPDPYCPTPDGGLPDCAAMLAAVEACTGEISEAIVGKPSDHMAAALLTRLGLSPERVLLVGDRAQTDVAMAHSAGMDSCLVLTGATGREAALLANPPPTYLANEIGSLLSMTPSTRRQSTR